jgi:hypothetical protein
MDDCLFIHDDEKFPRDFPSSVVCSTPSTCLSIPPSPSRYRFVSSAASLSLNVNLEKPPKTPQRADPVGAVVTEYRRRFTAEELATLLSTAAPAAYED